jgi:hypothetical protein
MVGTDATLLYSHLHDTQEDTMSKRYGRWLAAVVQLGHPLFNLRPVDTAESPGAEYRQDVCAQVSEVSRSSGGSQTSEGLLPNR